MLGSLAAWLVLASCSNQLKPVDTDGVVGDTDTDTDADSDTDADADADSDTDSDADADADSDADADPYCTDPTFGLPDPGGGYGYGDCITEQIFCGDDFDGTTVGGSYHYDYPEYNGWHCMGHFDITANDWSAAERVFDFEVPAQTDAVVTLESPCGKMALKSVATGDVCPTSSYTKTCEAGTWKSTTDSSVQTLHAAAATNPKRYEIVVDGLNGFEGNFHLKVDCPP